MLATLYPFPTGSLGELELVNVSSCEGFRMPAHRDGEAGTGAGVPWLWIGATH
jgi:hypothetical protein